jgi:hypothetical protein
MSVTLNASTSSGLVQTADTSGTIELQSNGTTKLTVSSSGVNIGQMNGGAITSGTAVASTSGTSIDFTGIPSWVKRITIMFSGVSTNGSSSIQIQLGDSGGIETSGYAGSVTQTSTTAYFSTGFILGDVAASSIVHGLMTICLIGSNNWAETSTIGGTSGYANRNGGGSKTLSDTLTQVRITMNGTDTFDAGTINILYEG